MGHHQSIVSQSKLPGAAQFGVQLTCAGGTPYCCSRGCVADCELPATDVGRPLASGSRQLPGAPQTVASTRPKQQ